MSMNELMAPEAIAERRRIQDALRRIAVRYQNGGCVVEEVAIRRAIEELFDAAITVTRATR
jgi:RecJ-like exonuclease